MPETWNLFAIGRRSRNEDQLTEMQAWLVDAVPELGDALIGLAFGGVELERPLNVRTQ